jgi:phosphoribosylformimino-5-aminoimidazole carboxamide ribotide isomerase
MIVIPAIDVEAGRVVTRVHGEPGTGLRELGRPSDWARTWTQAGARRLHVVDLDAAGRSGTNRPIVLELARDSRVPLQAGGGIRSTEEAEEVLGLGTERVVVASRAWQDAEWRAEVVRRLGGRVAFSLDVNNGILRLRGWTIDGPTLHEALEMARGSGVRHLVLTDIAREGTGEGPDLGLVERIRREFPGELQVAGGVASRAELRRLASAGVAGVIVGRALYDGTLPREIVGEDF